MTTEIFEIGWAPKKSSSGCQVHRKKKAGFPPASPLGCVCVCVSLPSGNPNTWRKSSINDYKLRVEWEDYRTKRGGHM